MANQMVIGEDGKVDVWDSEKKEKFRRYPIDAKEMIANSGGRYTLGGPTLRMVGDAGEVMVDAADMAMYVSKGYTLATEKNGKESGKDTDKDSDKDADADADADAAYDFTKHSKADLLAFANEAKVDATGLNREKLIEALDKAGFTPTRR